jgi:hypothetical protein
MSRLLRYGNHARGTGHLPLRKRHTVMAQMTALEHGVYAASAFDSKGPQEINWAGRR